MSILRALAAAPALVVFASGFALADGAGRPGHAIGPDLAALSQPLPGARSARGGHAFGQDLAALRIPIACSPASASGASCATTEAADIASDE